MIKAGVIGATGYAGSELVKLLRLHPFVSSVVASSKSYSGESYSQVYPNFLSEFDDLCVDVDIETLANECDVLFLSLPHGLASSMVTKEILDRCVVIDLGADFRLKDVAVYQDWYHTTHHSPSLLKEAVYGLSELYRKKISQGRLIANPGCYTTCSILSLAPLLKDDLIDKDSIIIDAKSGVSGAGRKAQLSILYGEVNESVKAYGITTHRHTPEIEQELSLISTKGLSTEAVRLSFTPHLIPMNRGILTTSYASVKQGVTKEMIDKAYEGLYGKEQFIRLKKEGSLPETRFVKGSNFFDLSYVLDTRLNRIVVVGAIDNIMKGAASQALQNMNIVFDFPESSGLHMISSFPM
jgi:N-acetyl-gamma-glutamyl-phosphate reductase